MSAIYRSNCPVGPKGSTVVPKVGGFTNRILGKHTNVGMQYRQNAVVVRILNKSSECLFATAVTQ